MVPAVQLRLLRGNVERLHASELEDLNSMIHGINLDIRLYVYHSLSHVLVSSKNLLRFIASYPSTSFVSFFRSLRAYQHLRHLRFKQLQSQLNNYGLKCFTVIPKGREDLSTTVDIQCYSANFAQADLFGHH